MITITIDADFFLICYYYFFGVSATHIETGENLAAKIVSLDSILFMFQILSIV